MNFGTKSLTSGEDKLDKVRYHLAKSCQCHTVHSSEKISLYFLLNASVKRFIHVTKLRIMDWKDEMESLLN